MRGGGGGTAGSERQAVRGRGSGKNSAVSFSSVIAACVKRLLTAAARMACAGLKAAPACLCGRNSGARITVIMTVIYHMAVTPQRTV